jgi:hypothetical protein
MTSSSVLVTAICPICGKEYRYRDIYFMKNRTCPSRECKEAFLNKKENKMKKLLIVLAMALLFVVPSHALDIKGYPVYCFNWVNDTMGGTDKQGVRIYDIQYSGCRTPSSDPNVFAMQFKMLYNAHGREYKQIPPDVQYSITEVAVNVVTGQINIYILHKVDFNGVKSVWYDYRLPGGVFPDNNWETPQVGTMGAYWVDITRKVYQCGGCK